MGNDGAGNEWAALANAIPSQNHANEDSFCSALDFSVKQPVEVPWPFSSVFAVINPGVNGVQSPLIGGNFSFKFLKFWSESLWFR